ncbi:MULTISPECIES: hypothetical protein [unclassified Ensifer]|uniref:hypothetical protein n=1 Tax=unclassified Ensifer TaxID=2633371 RepID=UPI000813D68E|nr:MULTISPECIES: hypothetical protein [unclassified Ensifer]OCP22438.1 hypothetical protein BC361_24605 [Ensifer sp. LC54]OCP22649.1 hypothetical protein BC363_26740 [Ensifer sp. LC384]
MSKMMVLGVKDETGLWLVDFDAGTVTALDGTREDYFTRSGGIDPVNNAVESVDVAVAFDAREEAFGGFMYRSPAVDLAVSFQPKEEAFSGRFYKSHISADGSSRSA